MQNTFGVLHSEYPVISPYGSYNSAWLSMAEFCIGMPQSCPTIFPLLR